MRVVLSGSFLLPGAPAEVMLLFTAEGERAWAPGWEPRFYDGQHVWATGDCTYWVTVDASPTGARYARITPDDTAGTVEVACSPAGQGTEVTVTYDLTAIGPAGEARLPGFAEGFPAMLEEWCRLTTPLVP